MDNSDFITQQDVKDFNIKEYDIYKDNDGIYTNEPLLMGIANHLHYSSNGFGGDDIGGISGSTPFVSAEDFIKRVNWAACEKFAAGAYKNYRSAVMNRGIGNVPTDFLSKARAYSQKTGLPVEALIVVGKSEGGFRNCAKNSYGYGGYFGSKKGPQGSFDEQADVVRGSFNMAKRNSPGADNLALLAIMYMTHHLPAVGSKYWKQTGGKIWSTDPNYIAKNAIACYPALANKKVTLAEHLLCNLAAQYMALQVRQKSF